MLSLSSITNSPLRSFIESAVVAVLYYGGAQLGLLFAVAPENTSPIWPPAAIALAAALISGYRAGMGVWIAAFLVNLSTLEDSGAFTASAIIATGSTLQMGLSAWLLRRVVGMTALDGKGETKSAVIPTAPGDILLFVGLTAITSLTAATIGALGLCATGFAPWNRLTIIWVTWWLGDYSGILILTPILLVSVAFLLRRPFAEFILFPFATICIGTGLVSSVLIWQAKTGQDNDNLRANAGEMVEHVRRAIDDAVENLGALEGFFAASKEVTRAEFKEFAARLLQQSPTTYALAWRPRIKEAELAAYEAAARNDGIGDFAIFEMDQTGKQVQAPLRDEYYPIYFIESPSEERTFLGYDVGSDPLRGAALNRARDTTMVVATAPTPRRSAKSTAQKNIVLVKALYRDGSVPDSLEARREQLAGFLQSNLRMDELVRRALASRAYRDLELHLFDVTTGNPEFIVAHKQGAEPLETMSLDGARGSASVHEEVAFKVGGRPWLAIVSPGSTFSRAEWIWEIWAVLIAAALMFGALLFYLARRQRSEAIQKAAEEHYRQLFESAPAMYVTTRANNGTPVITGCNQLFLATLDYTRDAVLGRSLADFHTVESRGALLQHGVLPLELQSENVQGERELLTKSGGVIPVMMRSDPILDADENLIGARAMYVDIAARKQMEHALRESEATTNLIIDSAPDAIIAVDESGYIIRVNKQAESLFGYDRSELIGMDLEHLVPMGAPASQRLHATGDVPQEHYGRHKAGDLFAVEVVLAPLTQNDRRLFMATIRDIRHRKAAEVAIRQLTDTLEERVTVRTAELRREVAERQHVETALKDTNVQLAQSIATMEERNREITLLSAMIQLVECCDHADEVYEVISRHLSRLFLAHAGALYIIAPSRNQLECVAHWRANVPNVLDAPFAPNDCWAFRLGRMHRVAAPNEELLCEHVKAGGGRPSAYLCASLAAHGETLGILHLRHAMADETNPAWNERLLQSVIEQLSLVLGNFRLRETLRAQTIRDPLTGLFNRRYMEESLSRDLQRVKRSGGSLAVVMMDVDHFKRFNDTFGHAAGDEVLRRTANLFKANMRGSDVVCRYGGEEFVIICPEMTLDTAFKKMDSLREELKRLSIEHQGIVLDKITISIGIAAFSLHGVDGETLVRAADVALYRAKNEGRDRVVIFEPSSDRDPMSGKEA